MGSVKDRIFARRAKMMAAAIAGAAAAAGACGNEPQACLSMCLPPSCDPQDDSGIKDGSKDVTSEPMVCLSMPPPDSGSDSGSDADSSG